MYRYFVYGISLLSEFLLDLPERVESGYAQIELRHVSQAECHYTKSRGNVVVRSSGYRLAHLEDGSTYASWPGIAEFLVSANGKVVSCSPEPEAAKDLVQAYLLGQALSFALVRHGLEPLHGAAVEDHGAALVLLGNSGFGKSTLAGSLVGRGCRLVTDDLLLLRRVGADLHAFPGPPRIKLVPESARRILGADAETLPMNSEQDKQVFAMSASQQCTASLPVRAIYALAHPRTSVAAQPVRIEHLTARQGFLALAANTFNRSIADVGRLERQLTASARLLKAVPVRRLDFPRTLDSLAVVTEALLADSRSRREAAA